MITCPTCGAGNRPGATVCRMCALRLEESAVDHTPDKVVDSKDTSRQLSTLIFPNLQTRPGTVEIGDEITCPSCQAINEAGWLYCHGCGRKLSEPPSHIDPSLPDPAQGLEPQQPAAPQARTQKAGVEENPPAARVTPPQSQAELNGAGVSQSKDRRVTEPTRQVKEPAKPVPVAENAQLRRTEKPGGDQPTTPVAVSGLYCPQCGSHESGNNPLCSKCGSPIFVNQTVVMSSVVPASQGRLLHILDGGESGEVYNLQNETVIGRTQGDISFAFDELMSSRHGRIIRRGDDFFYIDEDSRNGTFIKIKRELRLEPGDVLLIGKQLFRFEA